MGLVLLCRGRDGEAVEALEQALVSAQTVVDHAKMASELDLQIIPLLLLGRMYLARGDRVSARRYYERVVDLSAPETFGNWMGRWLRRAALVFASMLSGVEEMYDDPRAFREFCYQFPDRDSFVDGVRYSPDLDQFALVQWFLEPAAPVATAQPLLNESFNDPLTSPWVWHNAFGDCDYEVCDGLEIYASNGRGLWFHNLSAPRFLYPLSGVNGLSGVGFVFETTCVLAVEDRPTMGGLLLWIDKQNYLRLDRDSGGHHEIIFMGCVDNRDMIIGRGRLKADDSVLAAPPGRVVLRLEWVDGQVRALCSLDEVAWFTVGYIDFPFEASAQFGVYACGNIDRMIYHGAYPDGAAIRFTSLKCWELAV